MFSHYSFCNSSSATTILLSQHFNQNIVEPVPFWSIIISLNEHIQWFVQGKLVLECTNIHIAAILCSIASAILLRRLEDHGDLWRIFSTMAYERTRPGMIKHARRMITIITNIRKNESTDVQNPRRTRRA